VAPGEVLAGKYQVGAVLGQGGIGVVVSATHLLLNQKVAIKLLLDDSDQEQLQRFVREGQAAARLKGEHVARVLDLGQLPGGAPFMVMEFLEGRDLAAVLEQDGPLPIEDAVEAMLHACEAMAEAHAAGIVHRDLKPANLFLTTGPGGARSVKVVDFGISKDLGLPTKDSHRLTRTTSVLGSPLYMPPEQMRATRLADTRSDIWSMGVILHEILTGHPPFEAEFYPDLVLKVATQPPPPPSSLRPEVPPQLDAAILRCLEKKQEHRFQTVLELAAAIAPFGPARAQGALERIQRFLDAAPPGRPSSTNGAPPTSVGPVDARTGSQGAQTDMGGARTAPPPAPMPATPRRQLLRLGAATAAGMLVMALGAAAILLARERGQDRDTPEASETGLSASGAQATEPDAPAQPGLTPPGPGDVSITPASSAAVEVALPAPTGTPAPVTAAPAATPPRRPPLTRPSAGPTAAPTPTPPKKENPLDLPLK
jgi:serine/threonine-protein kinase